MRKANGKVVMGLFFGLVLAGTLAVWPAVVQAIGCGGGHGGMRGHHGGFGLLGGLLHSLDLSDAQKHSVALILKDHRENAKTLVQNFVTSKENFFSVMHSQEYNEAAVRQAAQETARWEEELAVLRAKVFNDIKKVLTAEQKQQLAERRGHFGDRMQDRIESGFDKLDKWIDTHAAATR